MNKRYMGCETPRRATFHALAHQPKGDMHF
jgi:hypothetical protein